MRDVADAGVGLLVALCLLLPPHAAASAREAASAASVETIAARVREARHPWLHWPRFPDYQTPLQILYAPGGYQALWLDGARPTAQARAAILALGDAGAKGLDPLDYEAPMLEQQRRLLDAGARASSHELALFDVALSVGMLRFVSDLHLGRVNPRNVGFGLDVEQHEFGALLAAALREGRVAALVEELEPRFFAYRRMRNALHRYQALASDPSVAPVAIAGVVKPGDPFPEAAALARWLAALGDLPPQALDAGPLDLRHDGALVAAVERFQARHGLEPDGVIGAATARALAVPAPVRVRQIELALERYRWIPEVGEQRFVFVNVPAFELQAFDGIDPAEGPALSMRVVAGRAGRTPTPVVAAAMRTVVFGPYWNVPRSIVANEVLPRLVREPDYLAEEEMEIVAEGAVLPETPESLAQLAAGEARLRQRPGAKNALGRVKFLFPNPHDVYLHDTPSRSLFRASRRDFSHGCVRVEQPEAFARWVLGDQPEWSEERIAEALASAHDESVPVRGPILVLLFYATVQARADGSVSFYEDLYGHDAALERTLARGYPFAP
jgi:murein L,D-transpeptidase YcbB/YkuD